MRHDQDPVHAEQPESFMRNSAPSIGRFFARMGQLDLKAGFAEIFRSQDVPRDYDAEVEDAEEITRPEKGWLDARIAERAGLDRYEQALLDFLSA